MDSLTTLACIKPTSPEKLERLREFYERAYVQQKKPGDLNTANPDNVIGQTMSPKTALRLLNLILSLTGEKRTVGMKHVLTDTAKTAIEIFYYFVTRGESSCAKITAGQIVRSKMLWR